MKTNIGGKVGSILGASLVVSTALAVLASGAEAQESVPFFAPREGEHRLLVVAHQGGELIRPSNTMVAFEHADELGSDVLDADVHRTADGELVLIHDETVDRTSDGTGAVADMTLAELQELDFGYWFTTDGGATYPYRGQDHDIVTLEELFSTFDDGIRFGLEIKQTGTEVAVGLCDAIVAHGYEDRVLVSSFDQESMEVFRETCPDVATSATEEEVVTFFVLHKLNLTDCLRPDYEALQVPETQYGITLLSQRFVDDAHALGLGVIPWTIDDPEDMTRIDSLEVEGINTNRPDLLVEQAD